MDITVQILGHRRALPNAATQCDEQGVMSKV